MKLLSLLTITLLPIAACAQTPTPVAPSTSGITSRDAQTETVKALIAVVPELESETNADKKAMALQGVATALARLDREKEALAVPVDQWTRMDIPHLAALSRLHKGDLAGARATIPRVKRAYSRADLLLAIAREYVKRKQPKQALPLVREAQRLMDSGAGAGYLSIGLLLAQCGDRPGAWQAFQKGRAAIEATAKRFAGQPGLDTYDVVVLDMLKASFTEQALQLAAKDKNTPFKAVSILLDRGAGERAIQFASGLKGRGQAAHVLGRLALELIDKGQVQNAKRALNLSREKAKASLDENSAMQVIAGWIFCYCRLGDLNTAKALVAKVPELKKLPNLEFTLLLEAVVSPLRDPAIEAKRVIWLQRVADQLNAFPAESTIRFNAIRVAEFLLDRKRKTEAMPFLEIADASLKNIIGEERAVSHVQVAMAWRKAGNVSRAGERAKAAASLAEGPNAWVAQRQLEAAGFRDEAIIVVEKRLTEPRKNDYEWGEIAAEQSSLRPAPPAAWIGEIKDPVTKATALGGWALGLSEMPTEFYMSGGPVI